MADTPARGPVDQGKGIGSQMIGLHNHQIGLGNGEIGLANRQIRLCGHVTGCPGAKQKTAQGGQLIIYLAIRQYGGQG